MFKSAFYALITLFLSGTSAFAQNANDVMRLFGGIMQGAIAQATLAEWRKLPQSELFCVDQTLRQQGMNIERAIQQGITPSDPRIANLRQGCRASIRPTDQYQQRSPEVSSATTATPSFNCFKAIYPDEQAICSSDELAKLDNILVTGYEYVRRKYGDQYARSTNAPFFQARRACGSDNACIKDRQITAIKTFQTLGAPISIPQTVQTQRLLWDHNGSTVYLVARFNSRKFYYNEPRPGMLSVGAKSGSLLFEGEAIDDRYEGTAYLFNGRCGQFPYRVNGPILDNFRRVELRGMAPHVDGNCRITGYVDDLLTFQLIEPAVTAENRSEPRPSSEKPETDRMIQTEVDKRATDTEVELKKSVEASAAQPASEDIAKRNEELAARTRKEAAIRNASAQEERQRIAAIAAAKRAAEEAEERRVAEVQAAERVAEQARKELEREQNNKTWVRLAIAIIGGLLIALWTILIIRSKRNRKHSSELATSHRERNQVKGNTQL